MQVIHCLIGPIIIIIQTAHKSVSFENDDDDDLNVVAGGNKVCVVAQWVREAVSYPPDNTGWYRPPVSLTQVSVLYVGVLGVGSVPQRLVNISHWLIPQPQQVPSQSHCLSEDLGVEDKQVNLLK